MKKVTYVQCAVCNNEFVKEEVIRHYGDAVPHCPQCGEHDMIFFSDYGYVGVEGVDKND